MNLWQKHIDFRDTLWEIFDSFYPILSLLPFTVFVNSKASKLNENRFIIWSWAIVVLRLCIILRATKSSWVFLSSVSSLCTCHMIIVFLMIFKFRSFASLSRSILLQSFWRIIMMISFLYMKEILFSIFSYFFLNCLKILYWWWFNDFLFLASTVLVISFSLFHVSITLSSRFSFSFNLP